MGRGTPGTTRKDTRFPYATLSRSALVEVELAVAALVGAAGGAAHLDAVLGGLAVLAVDLPIEAVGETGPGRVHRVAERHARAGLVVAAGHQEKIGRAHV